ncbi:hypothetical protein M433DRAFT_67935 [Acidomyces richmondensis BFW]|nr:MAG: hypothetical protein FE78DRAFT_149057 [Acidomyces sp. 'richmondensis']KYG45138.1 hypothetical protein M433DRAFT_67935 [Acidomyces richmondensis BFW]
MAEDNDLAAALADQFSLSSAGGTNAHHPPSDAAKPGQRNGSALQTASLPPGKQKTADEVLAEMSKVPLFMTSLDNVDEDNEQLEALKALMYEGTRAEIADNFRNQGNDCVKQKQFRDAREFYTKALQALKAPRPQPPSRDEGDTRSDARVVEDGDDEDDTRTERAIEEACHANRALCNLEMNCAAALKLNPRNIKAWYRAATACLALDKIPEALDACETGLKYEPANAALMALLARVEKRRDHLAELEKIRMEREERTARERAILRQALTQRNIVSRKTMQAPNMEDAVIALSDPQDAKSTLNFPVIFLYPLHAQSDFVKAFAEDESLAQHLEYILPTPWDDAHEYTKDLVDCYMETAEGGIIKAGKNVSLLKLLASGKVEVVDDLVKVNVLPKSRAGEWIEDFKKRKGKA